MDHTIHGYTRTMQFDLYKIINVKRIKKKTYIYTMYAMYNIKIYINFTTFYDIFIIPSIMKRKL